MRKKKIFLFLGLAIVLAGCAEKNEVTEIIQKDKIHEKALVYTKENQLVRSLETKATVTATLLNEVFPKRFSYDKGISFFVGVISDIPLDVSKKITLSGKTPLNVESVGQKDFLYVLMPGVNRWGNYYIVTFPSMKAKTFTLKLEIDPYGPVSLNFQRSTLRR
ncbi:hypothetical protein RZR97_09065 [Hydrogenimonas thermophila]|uniref:lipoprotein n=1 Tax=Hydrogenimonas thermophila TaxID=223786 RepID=UPI00293724D3|nr:hypothetical protein [Hydrogenimonas thermophila]WOE69260.1 hypothetical protein RZR91_09090 [Hydrogenimonas thermophila]WOE71770.1 hypothetical protein RZR97_09065 [Hydrogenimonas thermophila]